MKTENFDEFMKKLGVGLVKRKLANSVSPVNVIIVNEDGKYIIQFLKILALFYLVKDEIQYLF